MHTYTVKKGDTLSKIAKKHCTTVHALMSVNPGIKNANMIRVGQVINLPYPIPTNPEPTDADVGKKFQEVIKDVQSLQSFKELLEMI